MAFVASGGASKGIAHLGVLRAMEELALVPDVLVGTSAGAVAAAFVAMGLSTEELGGWLLESGKPPAGEDLSRPGTIFLGPPTGAQMRKPGWLFSGLLSIDRFEKYLRKKLPMNDFRELDRELLITAADVDGRGRAVFGRGHREDVPISEAVAASCCVPLLYRPHRIQGRYYVDGEIVRTLSLDLAMEAQADIIIVSNVYRPHMPTPEEGSLANQGLFAVARQALNVVLSEKERRGIDLLHQLHPHVQVLNVSPDLGRFSFTSRRDGKRLLSRGYREGLRVLAAAKRRGVFDAVPNVHTVGQA
ncbi:MAG: patatin-like phospholipase family protein [Myxococcota bacterium]